MRRPGRAWLRTRDEDPFAVFARGATLGAFVGAVIAGSTIWRRARRRPAGAPGSGAPRPLGRPAARSPAAPGSDVDVPRR
jgi:hypothetical protein